MVRDGIQKKLTRVRPPHAQISYDVQFGDTIERKDLPFVLGDINDGAIPSAPHPSCLNNRRFFEVSSDNFDRVFESMRPQAAASGDTDTGETLPVVDPAAN